MLEVTDLVVDYGAVRALAGISITADAGGILAVLGANGAGKTTLLRTISGLIRPRSGHVRFEGHDIARRPVEEIVTMGLGHVPEGRGVIVELTVEENLRLGALVRGIGRGSALAQVLGEIYDLFPPLAQRSSRLAATLSGGERQMLAIGRALAAGPRLLLLDEPSLGLAPMIVAQIMEVLRNLRDKTGMTVVLVEQNARSALSIADRVVVLNLGNVAISDHADRIAGDDRLRHAYLGF